jgi:3-dehydroquinate dehydratase-2
MIAVHVLNRPNQNLLGRSEPQIDGGATLSEVEARLRAKAERAGVALAVRRPHHEVALVDGFREAGAEGAGPVVRAGADARASVALRDATAGSGVAAVGVHLSAVHAREPSRRPSTIAPVRVGAIRGFGPDSDRLALEALRPVLQEQAKSSRGTGARASS